MNICIDIGNTNTEIGLVEKDRVVYRQRTKTASFFAEEDIKNFIDKVVSDSKVKTNSFDLVILSSVVPSKNQYFIDAVKELYDKDTLVITPQFKRSIKLNVDCPNEVGADLIADLEGAKTKYGYPCLIADLGTATKVLFIDKDGDFSSCVITPGIGLSASSLSSNTALLPKHVASLPKTIMAKNTVEAMNAGIIYGHLEMIEGLVKRYEKEIGYTCKHVLCGGFGAYLKDIAPKDFYFDDSLTFLGINRLGELNR